MKWQMCLAVVALSAGWSAVAPQPAWAQDEPSEEPAAAPLSEEDAAKRANRMAMDIREMVQPDAKRLENIAGELVLLGPPAVPTLLDLTTDPVPGVRQVACDALAKQSPPGALPILVARLGDDDVAVTVSAVRAVASYDDAWATRALVRWLAHPQEQVQQEILNVLGGRPKASIHNVIRHQLKSPPAGIGPGPFLAALGRFPDKKTKRELIAALDDPDLAEYGVRGLGFLGPVAAKDMGKWLLKRAKANPTVAAGVARALVGFGGSGDKQLAKVLPKMPLDLKREIVQWLVAADEDQGARRVTQLAAHKDAELRIVALELMPTIQDADPRPTLKKNLRHKNARVRALAAQAVVGPERDKQLETILIDRYREIARKRTAENRVERTAILTALGLVGRDAAVAELVQAIGHDDEVEAALAALGAVGEKSIGSLLFVIKTGDPKRTPLAVRALAKAGPRAVEPVLKLVLHRTRDVRNVARRALRDIGTPAVVPDIVAMIKDSKTPGREQLLALLGALYSDESYAALKMFARSSSEHAIRLAAVRVLAQQEDPRVLPVLRTVAEKDVNNAVRQLAVNALLWQQDHEAVPLLTRMLEYEKDFIRKEAAQALGYLARPKDVPEIIPKLSTPRDEVLTAVRNCLRRVTYKPRLIKIEHFEEWADEHSEAVERFASVKAGEMTLADGTVMHYWLGGKGRPLLVLPGGPDLSHRYLRPAIDKLMGSHLLVFVDLPGRGESTGPTEDGVSLGIEHDVASVATMLARLNLRELDVYAHGWGGLVAVRLAEKHPKLVNRMVLDNSPMPTLAGWMRRHEVATERIPEPWALDLSDLQEDRARWRPVNLHRITTQVLLTGSVARTSALLHLVPKIDGRPEVQGAILAPMGSFDFTARYAAIEKPTLMLYGHSSPLDPESRKWRDELGAANEAIHVVDLEGVGLVPFYEAPSTWEDAVSSFLR